MLKKILFTILDWTWCLPQNLIGLFIRYALNTKEQVYLLINSDLKYYVWSIKRGSMSLGKHIFITKKCIHDYDTIAHEFGHTIQSYILGPLYLLVIALPSLLWAWFGHTLMNKYKPTDYSWFYTEKWADYLANKYIVRF